MQLHLRMLVAAIVLSSFSIIMKKYFKLLTTDLRNRYSDTGETAFNLELSVSVIIATPLSSLTSRSCNNLKCSLTLALTVTHSFQF